MTKLLHTNAEICTFFSLSRDLRSSECLQETSARVYLHSKEISRQLKIVDITVIHDDGILFSRIIYVIPQNR